MSLPKIKYPTYTITIPSTQETVKFRPFTVKEEKILLTALQGEDNNEITMAIKEIVQVCLFEKIDVEQISTYDLEYIFLQLRAKSISNVVEIEFRNQACPIEEGNPCKKSVMMKIDLNHVKVQEEKNGEYTEFNGSGFSKLGKVIKITDNLGVTMKHPGIEQLNLAAKEKTEYEKAISLTKECISSVFEEDTVYERKDFSKQDLDDFFDSLVTSDKEKLMEFVKSIPKIRYETKFLCKTCGYEEPIVFEGMQSFFV